MRATPDKHIVLSFDTESDIGSWTQDYTSIDRTLPQLLDLLDRRQVRASFLWEGKAALHRPDRLLETARRGHDCGCHSYQHETLGEPSYFIPGDRSVLPEEIDNRLRKNTDIVRQVTGLVPVSFRAPRLWGSPAMLRCLDDLGYLVDSTCEIRSDEGEWFPYHPDPEDADRPGTLRILEFPVAGLTPGMLAGLPPNDPLKIAAGTYGTPNLGQWPLLRMEGVDTFLRFFRLFGEHQAARRNQVLAVAYFHPWEFQETPPVVDGPEATCRLRETLYHRTGPEALAFLDRWIAGMQDEGWTFRTLAEEAQGRLAGERETPKGEAAP